MFEHSSRYYLLEDATYCTPDGREIRYKRRRFLPQGEKLPVAHDVTTGEEDSRPAGGITWATRCSSGTSATPMMPWIGRADGRLWPDAAHPHPPV